MIIRVENLKKTYKMGAVFVNALDGVDLEVENRSFITIMGRSGSGKTTLLNMIGCLDKPSGGRVMIDGEEVTSLPANRMTRIRREKIGFIFQQHNLIPALTALENVMLPLRYARVSRNESKSLAGEMLQKVGLGERVRHYPRELSGGEQQRVAIARALVNRPSVVLADEPTGSVDTRTAREIVGLMRDLNVENNQTFIIVTHDPIVAGASDKIAKMVDGRIIETGDYNSLNPGNGSIEQWLQ